MPVTVLVQEHKLRRLLIRECRIPDRRIFIYITQLKPFLHPDLGGCYTINVLPAALGLAGIALPGWPDLHDTLLGLPPGSYAGPLPDPRPRPLLRPPPVAAPARGPVAPVAPAAVAAAHRNRQALRKQVSRKNARIKLLLKRLTDIKAKLRAATSGGKTGRKLTKFSIRGGLECGLRRNAQNTPTTAMGLSLRTDAHHSTVASWEVKFDAALRASSRWHYTQFEEGIMQLGGCATHLMRSDATNAKIWHNLSAHMSEYWSLYSVYSLEDGGGVDTELFQTKFLGDIQVIEDKSGRGVRDMLIHQSRSIGFPDWTKSIAKLGVAPSVNAAGTRLTTVAQRLQAQWDARDRDEPTVTTETYIQVTDSGPDQMCARKIVALEILLCLYVWHLAASCLHHGGHIGCRVSLKVCEWLLKHTFDCDVGGFSSLAKFINIWRDSGRQFYDAALARFGPDIAISAFKYAPARCLTERWGSSWLSEARVINATPVIARRVTHDVLTKKAAKRRPEDDAQADADLTELRDEEHAFYRLRHGRWGTEASRAINADEWWTILRIGHRVRTIFHHLFLSQQKHHGDVYGYFAQLVWGKLVTFHDEIAQLFLKSTWDESCLRFVTPTSPEPMKSNVEHAICVASLNACAEFYLRVCAPVLEQSKQLLILAKEKPHVECDDRKHFCKTVMAAPLDFLHATVLKVRIMFGPALVRCAHTGILDGHDGNMLWHKTEQIARLFKGDSQNIEGLNNTLKGDLRRAPHTQVVLANSRTANKHSLGVIGANGAQTTRKHSILAPRIEGLLDEAVSFFAEADDVLRLENRFATPPGAVAAPVVERGLDRGVDPTKEKRPSLEWATYINSAWYYTVANGAHVATLPTTALSLSGLARLRFDVWVPGTILRRLGQLIKCKVVERHTIEVCRPVVSTTTLDLLERQYDAVQKGKRLHIYAYTVRWSLTETTFRGHICDPTEVCDLTGDDGDDAGDAMQPKRRRSHKSPDDAPGPSADAAPSAGAAGAAAVAAASRAGAPVDDVHHAIAEVIDDLWGNACNDDGGVDWVEGARADASLTRSEWLRLKHAADRDAAHVDAQAAQWTHDDPDAALLMSMEEAAVVAIDGPPLPPPGVDPPPMPGAALPPLPADCFLSEWLTECTTGTAMWNFIHDHAGDTIGGPPAAYDDPHCSLVEHWFDDAICVSLVHWLSIPERKCRIIDIDRHGGLITIVPTRNPELTLSEDHTHILPDVGVWASRRRARTIRLKVPEIPLRIIRCWRIAQRRTHHHLLHNDDVTGGGDDVRAPACCACCGRIQFEGPAAAATLAQCANCCLCLHTGCMNGAYDDLKRYAVDITEKPDGFPLDFEGAICRLCAHFWSM